jgi:hypothetical protein
MRLKSAKRLSELLHGSWLRAAGIVTCRERPSTASGVIFVTLEDETGNVNVIVWNNVLEKQRRELLQSRLLGVGGAASAGRRRHPLDSGTVLRLQRAARQSADGESIFSLTDRDIPLVIEQMIERVFEGAGEQLLGKNNRKKLRTAIDSLVAGHPGIDAQKFSMPQSCSPYMTRAISHDALSTPSTRASPKVKPAKLLFWFLSMMRVQGEGLRLYKRSWCSGSIAVDPDERRA